MQLTKTYEDFLHHSLHCVLCPVALQEIFHEVRPAQVLGYYVDVVESLIRIQDLYHVLLAVANF